MGQYERVHARSLVAAVDIPVGRFVNRAGGLGGPGVIGVSEHAARTGEVVSVVTGYSAAVQAAEMIAVGDFVDSDALGRAIVARAAGIGVAEGAAQAGFLFEMRCGFGALDPAALVTFERGPGGGVELFPEAVRQAIADLGSGSGAVGDFLNASALGVLPDGTDQTAAVTAAAAQCRTQRKGLRFDGAPGTAYNVAGANIAGITVTADPGVLLAEVDGVSAFCLTAVGTSGARITAPTRLIGVRHAGGAIAKGLLEARYADDVRVEDFSVGPLVRTGGVQTHAIYIEECIRPRVISGETADATIGVGFVSCTNPVAAHVRTKNSGRDGVLFYTNLAGTTTTDAVAIACDADGFALRGEGGRAGVHFYGVRRATSLACSARNDGGLTDHTSAGIRFRDCEDFFADGYAVADARVGVGATQIGDYAAAPHNIVTRGNIGAGSVSGVREIGVFVTAIPCDIEGARVHGLTYTAGVTSGAGIWHEGTGRVAATIEDVVARGLWARAGSSLDVVCKFSRAGTSTLPALEIAGEVTVAGNSFSDNRGTPESTMAIRVVSGGAATIGENTFGAGITSRVSSQSGGTIRRGSRLVMSSGGAPGGLSGTTENGVLAIDTNGVYFRRTGSTWKRVEPVVVTAEIGTTQTSVSHTLGYTPTVVTILPGANANVWESAAPNTSNVFLTASATVTCKIACM